MESIDVICHGLLLQAADDNGSAPSSSSTTGTILLQSKEGRYTLKMEESLNDISLVVSDPIDEKVQAGVVVSAQTFGSVRRRGWRRLRLTGREANQYSAYAIQAEDRYSLVILRRPDTANWMRQVPDDTPLGELCIPGTHESCALYGVPFSQCQQPTTPIDVQLQDGIRYLDVRLRVVGDELLMYHGPRPQRSSLPILLSTLHSFLVSHPTETFILCLKEETPPVHPNFSALVYAAFRPFEDKWVFENRIPRVGEVRGKGILMTRFEGVEGSWETGLGIHPSTWPDSRPEGFTWDCSGTTVRTQDWYRVKYFFQIPEKFQVITNHLTPTLQEHPGHPFTLSYTSASAFPLSLPSTIAKGMGWPDWGLGIYGINHRFVLWLLLRIAEGRKVRACVPMDFYRQEGGGNSLAELLVLMNSL